MPKKNYKLYYFNVRARAEPARLTFAAAGIEYEDIRFKDRDDWLKQKEELCPPFKQAPLLVIDDPSIDGKIKIAQSMAIMKYIAREGGLCPTDNVDIAKCDMIVDADADLIAKRVNAMREKDEEKKKELLNEVNTKHVPEYLEMMQNLLEENDGGKGFFVGKKLTYADIVIFNVSDNLQLLHPGTLDKFPSLLAHYERIKETNPGIKAWLEKRPVSSM